jgi:hypothetical protein
MAAVSLADSGRSRVLNMDTEQIEQALRNRAPHHEATFVVEQLPGGGWQAAFKREDDDDFVVLSAEARTREDAVRQLYEADELDDLRGG